jgi:hypothetical protein
MGKNEHNFNRIFPDLNFPIIKQDQRTYKLHFFPVFNFQPTPAIFTAGKLHQRYERVLGI